MKRQLTFICVSLLLFLSSSDARVPSQYAKQSAQWLRSSEGRRIADNVLTWQTPSISVFWWLLAAFGWTSSFYVIAALSLAVALLVRGLGSSLPVPPPTRGEGSYFRLLINPTYLRYALSQAFTLGGLLIFVFGAPAMMTRALGLSLNAFILLPCLG